MFRKVILLLLIILPVVALWLRSDKTHQFQHGFNKYTYAVDAPLIEDLSHSWRKPDSILWVQANPKNSKELVATGRSACYLSKDEGQSWAKLGESPQPSYARQERVAWNAQGVLWSLAYPNRYTQFSLDSGLNWSNPAEPDILSWNFDSELRPWAQKPTGYVRPQKNDSGVKLTPAATKPDVFPFWEEQIEHHTQSYPATITTTSNKIWAATPEGLFWKKSGAQNWTPLDSRAFHPSISKIIQSPTDSFHLALLDTAGRVWESDDFGKNWRDYTAQEVTALSFSKDGSLILARQNKTVKLEDVEFTIPKDIWDQLLLVALNLKERKHSQRIVKSYRGYIVGAQQDKEGRFWFFFKNKLRSFLPEKLD